MDVRSLIPVYGGYHDYQRIQQSEESPFLERAMIAAHVGAVQGTHLIFGVRHGLHMQAAGRMNAFHYLLGNRMRTMVTRGPAVVGAIAAIAVSSELMTPRATVSHRHGAHTVVPRLGGGFI